MTRCRHEGELRKAGVKLVSAEGEYGRTAEMIAVVNALIEERWELANAAPTTLPGLVAYLDYLLAEGERLSSTFHQNPFLKTTRRWPSSSHYGERPMHWRPISKFGR